MERRRQNRVQLRIPCELRSNGRTVSATLLDLSEGGLSVRLAEEELEQGTPTVVILAMPRGEQLMVESLVWHSRRLKPRRDEKAALVVGLVVANPSEAYLKLVADHDKARTARPRPAVPVPAPAPGAATPAPATAPTPVVGPVWRVRLQLSGSPRSRTILVETENAQDAAVQALEEAGAGWIVLEVTEA
ncbi:MAG TPA: PilZ domain-containing protein [Myxococcota bacterium]|nr:PilZ domain-containing protein [Myxococcota bacterium]